jgi:DNA-binding transcriptional LysR family regulator
MAASLDEILELVTFARVVEATTMTGAAERLGTSKSVVSTRLAALEARLGTRLLHRTTRRLTLTSDGLELYPGCAQLAAAADEAQRSATRGVGPRGVLRVGAPVSFPQDRLLVCFLAYLKRYPEVRVELVLNDRRSDLVGEEIDLSLRVMTTQNADSSLVVRKLCGAQMVVVGSPAYLARRGTPAAPAELVQHDCLRYAVQKTHDEWRFRGADGWYSVPVAGHFSSQNGGVLRDAALAGLGLAMMPDFTVAEDLRRGSLVRVFAEVETPALAVCAVHAAGRAAPAKVRAFVDVLVAELRLDALPTGPRAPRSRRERAPRPG